MHRALAANTVTEESDAGGAHGTRPALSAVQDAFSDLLSQGGGLIPWLDLLRSAAILLVIGGHCVAFGFQGLGPKVFYWGWTGVDLFFVLSGYLIGAALWRELDRTRRIHLGKFFVRRALRIWPLYFATIAAYALWDILTRHPLHYLLNDVFFISNYRPLQVQGGWSLSTEEQFYLLFPLLLISFRRVPCRLLVCIPILWLTALPILRHHAMALHPGAQPGPIIYSPFHTHSDGLAIGVLLALLSIKAPQILKRRSYSLMLAIGMLAAGVVARIYDGIDLSYSALALIYGSLLVAGLNSGPANRVASWRGFHIISRLSFGMYLNHMAIIAAFTPLFSSIVDRNPASPLLFAAGFILLAGASAAASFMTFTLIELPFLRLRDKWLARWKRVPAQEAENPVASNAAATTAVA